jgi:hypothetical protein
MVAKSKEQGKGKEFAANETRQERRISLINTT